MTPRNVVRSALSIVATAGLMWGMTLASAAPVPQRDVESARLRLSWNARPERIEVCRTRSEEELERREEHMRQRVECDGRFATYELRVEADGRPLHESAVRGAGLRNDRPIYLLREIDIAPGVHRLLVSFVRREKNDETTERVDDDRSPDADTGLFAGRARREVAERARRRRAAIPPRLVLDTTIALHAQRTIVVTFDPAMRALRLIEPQSR